MTTLALLPELFVNGGLAVAGGAAVAIPVAIHLLTRLRRQRQPWAAMRFLMEAYRRQRQRLRIEQWLLLLVRCLILVVLGLALAGPLSSALSRTFGGDTSGRLVCLVIDDALSSQAATPDQHTRLDGLRATAGKIVDALGPGDRAALWTTARPVAARITPPTGDLALVRRTLTDLHSAASRSDWPATLASVNATLSEQNLAHDRVAIFLLGDFSAGALEADRPPPASLASLGTRGQLVVSHPAPTAPNVQVSGLLPFRSMVLAEDAQAVTIPVAVAVRRFGTDAGGTSSSVQVDLLGDDPGTALASVKHDFKWSSGQASALVNLDVQVPPDFLKGASPPAAPAAPGAATSPAHVPISSGEGSGHLLTLRATVQSGGEDVLPLDNQRLALVELRRRLEIGVIDEASASVDPGSLRPRDWLAMVLAPQPSRSGHTFDTARTIDLIDLSPALIDGPALSRLDAAMVLRPDRLGPPGWAALKVFAQRGGLVWVFTPPSEAPALWAAAFHDQFGLDWQPGLAPQAAGDGPDTTWKVAVDSPTPEPLRLLSADWQALLRPVSVHRRIDLGTRGGQESAWLRVGSGAAVPGRAGMSGGSGVSGAATAPASTTPSVLLAGGSVGEGHVIFLATALDPAWSNLVTKPLFLPLVHETLRGVLGSGVEAARLNSVICGQQPTLGARWEGAQEVQRWGGRQTLGVLRSDHGLQLATPVELPGVYVAHPGAGLRMAVNPDADAGNTTALDTQVLSQWLTGLGAWTWLDEEAPAKVLLAEPPRTNLGWPLLWVTLALLLLETYLARAFSHAQVPRVDAGATSGEVADDLHDVPATASAVQPVEAEQEAGV